MNSNNEIISKLPQFFMKMLKEQYGEEKTKIIIEGYKNERVVTFRVNTLKSNVENIEKELRKAGIKYKKILWNKDAFIIENIDKKALEDMEIYKNGEIYLQSLSSMLPAVILNPKENIDILDMAAAPGGKTTQIAALTNNKSHITACEINKIRSERLKYNIEKQGATCVFIMNKDARQIDDFFSFDKILLDAPCSGSGILSIKNEKINEQFTINLINKTTKIQLELLKKAIKILKKGQEMVYSTCSILECENEEIIKKAIQGTTAEVIPIEFEGKESLPMLSTKIEGTICICPNEEYEGFFVAKIKKK